MRIFGICEDEKAHMEQLRCCIQAWASQRNETILIKHYASSVKFESALEDEEPFDALFFDIALPGKTSGLELAETVRKSNGEIPIVMVTSNMELVYDTYHLSLTGYIVKPATQDKVFPMLDRLVEKLDKSKARTSLFRYTLGDKSVVTIPYSEVLYFQSNDHHIEIHSNSQYPRDDLLFRSSMKQLMTKLEEDGRVDFMRAHRSLIVNANYISKISGSKIFLLGPDNIVLDIGLSYNTALVAAFTRYSSHR